jgi:sulfite reductase (ferredoxin)
MTSAIQVKETNAQRAERLKREKNPWLAFDEVRAFARQGRASVLPEWANHLLQVVGHLHTGRRRGRHRRQGRRGAGLGLLHDAHRHSQRHSLSALASFACHRRAVAQKYARNLADITVRQCIQLHWLTIESLPEIVRRAGRHRPLAQGFACGDVVRNVTGCPLAGVAADELIDASPLALEIAQRADGEPGFLQSAAQIQSLRHRLPFLVRLIRRSTTSPSPRPSSTAKSATRCASAAASPRSRILPFA